MEVANQQLTSTGQENAPAPDAYVALIRRRRLILSGLTLLLCLSFLLDIANGPAGLGVAQALDALFGNEGASRAQSIIMWQVRLPQALTAILVGASLSLAGAEMQTILDNPLASPFTLGVSSAASLGAALAFILRVSLPGIPVGWLVPANAFLFAFGSVMLLQVMASRRGAAPDTLVLLGIAMVFAFNALVALLQFVASESALQQFVFWTMGNIAQTGWSKIAVHSIVLAIAIPWSFSVRWQLTALRFGTERARSFGVSVVRLRFMTLLRIRLLAALSVAFVGTIGFVGLVGPHIARLLTGEDHRFFLPASLLTGAVLMSLASLASKMLIPGVLLPVGIVTSLVGIPVFIFLIMKRRAV